MRPIWPAVLATVALGAPLRAQQPAGPPPAEAEAPGAPARAAELRRMIEDRFAARVKQQLGLTDQQTERLRATTKTYGAQRRDLQDRERTLRSALAGQLRPGVAADQDSVARLTDALLNVRTAYVQTFRDENAELAKFLDPVQRSRLMVMRERLMRRVQEIRARRAARAEEREGPRLWRFRERGRPQ
jgi:hypothetical protein